MKRGIGIAVRVLIADRSNVRDLKKRARHGLWKGVVVKTNGSRLVPKIMTTLTRMRHWVWSVNLMAGHDIWSGEIRLWWSSPKRERPWCGARCRDGNPCEAPPVWDKRLDRPVNGRCRLHGGLSTGPKTQEGRQRIAESNRFRSARLKEKRGKRQEVTQRGEAR